MTRGQTHQVEGEKIEKLKTKSEQAKKSKTNKVGQRNKLWLIKTTNNNEGGDKHGVDYQDNNTDNEIHTDNNNVRQRNKWWLIKTTNNEEGGEYGVDYQDNYNIQYPISVPRKKCGKFMMILQHEKCDA